MAENILVSIAKEKKMMEPTLTELTLKNYIVLFINKTWSPYYDVELIVRKEFKVVLFVGKEAFSESIRVAEISILYEVCTNYLLPVSIR